MPSTPPHAARSPEGFDLQGHRGARGLAPENTLPACRRALELGVTTLEMDVVVARDGTVVVSHEPWMNARICRTPAGERIAEPDERAHNIYEMDYDQVASYDCGSLRHPDFPEQVLQSASKPRLRDVFDRAEAYVAAHDRAPVFYNIEVKSRPGWDETFHPDPETFVRRVLSVVAEEDVASRTTIQSFDPRILEELDRENAGVRVALLVGASGAEEVEERVAELSFVPEIYSPHALSVDADLLSAVHDRGMTLIPWTVNDPDEMRHLIALGVDGLITDYPDRAQAVLRKSGR